MAKEIKKVEICRSCNIEKPITKYYWNRKRNQFSYSCKDCVKRKRKEYYQKNKEEVKDRVSLYYKKNKLKIREYRNNWNKEDRKNNPLRHKEKNGLYRANNREKCRQWGRNYRAKKEINGGSHTEVEWKILLNNIGRMCAKCGSFINIEKDHIKPISKGGSNDIDNLQPLCLSCNRRKSAKEINYIPRLLFFRECFMEDLTKFRQEL